MSRSWACHQACCAPTQRMCSALGGDVVHDGRQQALSRRAVEHAEHACVRLGREELEDGQHAPRADVVAVQEAQCVRNRVPARHSTTVKQPLLCRPQRHLCNRALQAAMTGTHLGPSPPHRQSLGMCGMRYLLAGVTHSAHPGWPTSCCQSRTHDQPISALLNTTHGA